MQLWQWGLRGLLVVALAVVSSVPSAARADEEEDPFYEGFFSGYFIYLRQADLSVGIFSDAALKDVYDKDTSLTVAKMHAGGAAGVEKELTKIAKSDAVEKEDAAVIKKMAVVAGLVKKQAETLHALLEGDKSQAAAFTEARGETSKVLAALEKDLKEYLSEE
ncbi:MAG: hypothetical protein QM775_30500 [Pirellulales bacterium]